MGSGELRSSHWLRRRQTKIDMEQEEATGLKLSRGDQCTLKSRVFKYSGG